MKIVAQCAPSTLHAEIAVWQRSTSHHQGVSALRVPLREPWCVRVDVYFCWLLEKISSRDSTACRNATTTVMLSLLPRVSASVANLVLAHYDP